MYSGMRKIADFKRGIKAGAIAGAICAVISLALAIALDNPQLLYPPFSWVETVFGTLSFGGPIVRGIIFGAIFAALYDVLPGTSAILKGVVLSFFLWVLTVVEVTYINLSWPLHFIGMLENGSYYGGTIDLSSVSLALINIMSALFFAVLTGFFWNRFGGKELGEERKGRPALLLSFIVGAVAWAIVAWPSINFMVGTGVPFTHVFVFPWRYVALPSLFLFVGLIGWTFALVAWRRTRKGESGFGWGLAGGIMMAASGIMLLPGALAIAGGVFSRRKAAGEPATPEPLARDKVVSAGEQKFRTSVRRNLALLTTSAVMLAAIIITGLTMATPVADYTTVALSRYSSTAISRSGLSLTMSLDSTDYRPGEQIAVNIGEKNIVPAENLVRPADRWPVSGLSISPCGTLYFAFGISILQGYYNSENVSEAAPLQIFSPTFPFPCPTVSGIISYDFRPWSDHADVYVDYGLMPWSANMTISVTVAGFWTGSSAAAVASNFTPGMYTLVGGDEWGALVILHFTVY
jgi:hypothetical protein